MKTVAEILQSHEVVDANGRHVGGTDKHGANHRYGDAYEDIINNMGGRDSIRLLMEIGVADGACLRAWREAFPNAQIVGVDIHHSDQAHGDRIEFHLGDQRSRADCERAAGGRKFDLIIDDGTHLLEDVLRTLFWLWPSVRQGGVYVIEDGGLQDCEHAKALFPFAEVVNTQGPFGGVEPLVVLHKATQLQHRGD